MKKAVIILSIVLSAGSASALDCDTPEGTRAVRGGYLVKDLNINEELALEKEIDDECDEGIAYSRYYKDSDDPEPKYKVDVICYRDSGPSGETTLDLDC